MVARFTSQPMAAPSSHSGESRRFSEPVVAALVKAMREFDSQSAPARESLRQALEAAAAEARERGFVPEEVVLSLKSAQLEAGSGKASSVESLERLRASFLTGMLEAYFRRPGGPEPS